MKPQKIEVVEKAKLSAAGAKASLEQLKTETNVAKRKELAKNLGEQNEKMREEYTTARLAILANEADPEGSKPPRYEMVDEVV